MDNPNANSVDPKNNSSTPATESPRNPDLIPQIPPPVKGNQETTHCKPDQTPLWKMILETGAVFVGLYVAGIYHGQLVVMQGQLGEIIKQYPELQKSAIAAKSAADTARDTFVVGQRPWVKMKPRILQPLTFDLVRANGPAAVLTVEHAMDNIGQSVALEVFLWADLIPLDPPSALDPVGLKTARARREEWCETNRHRRLPGYILFPHDDPIPQEFDIGALMVDVHKAADANTGALRGKVGFVLVGCVVYRSSFEEKTAPAHETKFMYLLGEPVGGPLKPYVKPVGVAGKLRLVVWPDGFSAD